jgi:hypothetical protein
LLFCNAKFTQLLLPIEITEIIQMSLTILCIATNRADANLPLVGDIHQGSNQMTSRKTIALSVVAVLASASAAMAATTHTTHHRTNAAAEARAAYAAAPRSYNQAGPYYYDSDSNGSVWSYYPGYVPMKQD